MKLRAVFTTMALLAPNLSQAQVAELGPHGIVHQAQNLEQSLRGQNPSVEDLSAKITASGSATTAFLAADRAQAHADGRTHLSPLDPLKFISSEDSGTNQKKSGASSKQDSVD